MKVKDIEEKLGYTLVQKDFMDEPVEAGYTSDLLSDVMGNAPADAVLITIQAHKNTVAVASNTDALAIVICNNRDIPHEMIHAAKEQEIAVFVTKDNQFTASWKIHQLLES